MSLIDKQLRAAKLQREFAIKIEERAYKSFNGSRQTARNFREGTLNIGQMGFDNTAEERITKEMITDYHKKEQDRIEERLKGREKTTLHDTIEGDLVTPIETPWKAGVAATTADLTRVGAELNAKVNELTMYREVLRTAPKKIDELEYQKVKQRLKAGGTKWMALQIPINKLNRDISQANAGITSGIETDVTNLQAEYRQIEENIKLNEQSIINANVANKEVVKKYEGVFNEQNKNLYSVKQEPYESEKAYIQRIKQLDDMKYDPTLYANRAATENSKELMTNLKQVINDDVKISEIIKLLPSDIHFDINKYWPKFKDTILKIYGPNNKQATAANYAEFLAAIWDTIDTKGSLVTVLTGAEPKLPAPAPAPPPPAPAPPPPSVFDIALSADKKTLMVSNTSSGLTIYIKITTGSDVLFSDVDKEGTYRKFFFSPNITYPYDVFDDVMKTIGLLKPSGGKTADFLNLFGAVSTTKKDYYNFLQTDIGLEKFEPSKKNFNHADSGHAISVGWGMKNDDVPKHAHFGKNIILLNKLYFQNVLSIKDKKKHSVENFPNVKVSDKLTDILYHMCIKNTKPTKEIINSLNATEKKLFDLLLYVSGLGKNIGTNKDENISELKDRLKLVESQIKAGNNNPVVKKEMKEIIQKLYLYKVISHNNGKAYLNQF
jgi:hypothetical protein